MSPGQHTLSSTRCAALQATRERNIMLCSRCSHALHSPFMTKIPLCFLLSALPRQRQLTAPLGNILLSHTASHSRATNKTTQSPNSLLSPPPWLRHLQERDAWASVLTRGSRWSLPVCYWRPIRKRFSLYKNLESRKNLGPTCSFCIQDT